MDEFVRRIMRQAQAGDPDAWGRIESALQRQAVDLLGLQVWVVRYSHRYGTDIGVHLTSEGAYAAAKRIMADYWQDIVGSDPATMPDDVIDALEIYNDSQSGEYIEIEDRRLAG